MLQEARKKILLNSFIRKQLKYYMHRVRITHADIVEELKEINNEDNDVAFKKSVERHNEAVNEYRAYLDSIGCKFQHLERPPKPHLKIVLDRSDYPRPKKDQETPLQIAV